MSHHTHQSSLAAKVLEETGADVGRCYQCGKCSAGCPAAAEMDITPSAAMRLLQYEKANTDKELLQSETVWLCLSCETCISRCPMQIDIPAIMDYLRQESLRGNYRHKSAKHIVDFHRAFMDMVRRTGRSYETGLVIDYKVRSGKWLQDMTLAPKMLAKGKLPLFPEYVENKKSVRQLFKKTKP